MMKYPELTLTVEWFLTLYLCLSEGICCTIAECAEISLHLI